MNAGRSVTSRLYEYLAWWQQRYGFVPRKLRIPRVNWIELCVENKGARYSDEEARIDAKTIISCNFWGVEITQRSEAGTVIPSEQEIQEMIAVVIEHDGTGRPFEI